MNIWIVNQYAIPPTQAGPTRHYDLARELIIRGHSVTILASSFDHFVHAESRLLDGENWRVESIDDIDFLWIRTPPYHKNGFNRVVNMLHFACSLWWRKEMFRRPRPDIVIGSSPTMFAAFGAERLARRYKVPFVLEVRDVWPQSLVDLGNVSPSHPVVKLLEVLEHYLYRRADHIVSLLPDVRKHVVARGANPDTISWLPNGVKLQPFEPLGTLNPDRPFVALYAGAHGTANSLDALLDAGALLDKDGWANRIRIRLVGNGPQKPRLQERVRNEHLSVVEFGEQVPKSKVPALLAKANVLLLILSGAEVYTHGISPNKLYHYMAAARPVLLANNLSNNPINESKCGLTVPADDPAALAEALKLMASLTPEQAEQMGMRGRAYLEGRHDMETLGAKLEQILKTVCRSTQVGELVPLRGN